MTGTSIIGIERNLLTEEQNADAVSFGVFTADLDAGELYRRGVKLSLTGIPFQILEALLERPGAVVTRHELRRRIWGEDTYVDFDNSLNSAVNRLRQALDDAAANPRFVETVPRRGYRFLAPVERPSVGPRPARRAVTWWLLIAAGLLVAGTALALLAIRRGSITESASEDRRIMAILPFRDLNAEPGEEYLADGLTEETIAQLGRRRPDRLGVIASASALRYKGTSKPIAQIGRELGVDYLLEGSVRRQDGRARITAQLVRVDDRTQLWADTYDRPVSEALALHAEVARAVADAVEDALLPPAPQRREAIRDLDPAAYEAYLQGRYAWNRRTADSLEAARRHFERAIAVDPGYELAHVGLAETYLVMHSYQLLSAPAALPPARAAAHRALELDSDLAEAYAALASVRLELEWDFAAAGDQYRRAIALHPSYATARQWHAEYLSMVGRHDQAMAEIRRAAELDPLSLVIRTMKGAILYFARRWDATAIAFDRALDLDPDFRLAHILTACTATGQGRTSDAVTRLERLVRDPVGLGEEELLLAYAYARAGRHEPALAIIAGRQRDSGRPPSAYHLALVRSALGDHRLALDELERAIEQRDRWMLFLKVDPRLDPLRDEPRFQDLLERMGFPDR